MTCDSQGYNLRRSVGHTATVRGITYDSLWGKLPVRGATSDGRGHDLLQPGCNLQRSGAQTSQVTNIMAQIITKMARVITKMAWGTTKMAQVTNKMAQGITETSQVLIFVGDLRRKTAL